MAKSISDKPTLAEKAGDAVANVMRTMISSRTWHRLTAEHGLSGPVAAEAAAWAWTVLNDAVARGDLPTLPAR